MDAKGLLVHPSVTAGFIPTDSYGGTTDTRLSGERAMLASVLCYAAIHYRMTKISEAPLYVVDETAEGEPWVRDHPLADLLETPNPDQEMADLLEETQQMMDLDGRVAWMIERALSGKPARLRAYGAHEFSVAPADGRIYGLFRITTESGTVEKRPDDVVFFRYPHPSDRWDGLSPTDVVLSKLGIEGELWAAIKAGLRNSVVPGMTVQQPGSTILTPEQRREYLSSLKVQYAAARNHGTTFVAEGGATVTHNTLGFKGLEGGSLYREVEAAVSIAYGVRPEILGMIIGLENAPWSHMDTAQRFQEDETNTPLRARYARTITRQLLRPVDPDRSRKVVFDTSKVRALQPDRERNARVSVLVRGIATPNQRRQMVGMEPMTGDPWWDARPESERGPAGAREPSEPKGRSPGNGWEVKASSATLWRRFDVMARAAESAWTGEAVAQLEADRHSVLALAARHLRPAKVTTGEVATKDDDVGPADSASARALSRAASAYFGNASSEEWDDRVRPLITRGARQAVRRAATEAGVSFDLAVPGIEVFAEREAAWLVGEISRTTRTAVAEAIADGMAEGESVQKISARIARSGTFSRSRAELIARTESTRVANGAALEGMQTYAAASGDRITKAWLSAQDDEVRDEHADLDGETVEVNEVFSNGLQHPGEPNCRCTLVYAMEDT